MDDERGGTINVSWDTDTGNFDDEWTMAREADDTDIVVVVADRDEDSD